jgi:DNA polymerase III subunit delta'
MFDPLLMGHQPIRERLLSRVRDEKLGGSLLFTGPDGVGKRRVAMELAQRELCFRRTACGQCEGCRMFQGDLPVELPNLLRIAPEGKAGLIRIGAIREDDLVEGGVISWAHRAPPPGCHRWILVEDAHRLNGASANMLLKTLEEPPPGTTFLLVTHRPEAMLPTIRSRCERITFRPLDAGDAWAVARRAGWEGVDRERWTALACGTLRYLDPDAFQRACDQLEAWLALCAGAAFTGASGPLTPDKASEASQSEQVSQALELLLLVLGDVARLREGKAIRLTPWAADLTRLAESPMALDAPQARVFEALRSLGRNPFADSLLREVAMACC